MTPATVGRFLPEVYRAALLPGSPTLALCGLMAHYMSPVEEQLERLERTFAAYQTKDEFVPYLAGWVDMLAVLTASAERDGKSFETLSSGHGRLRELVAISAELSRLRGTSAGMRRILETATGCAGFVVEEDAERPFHFHIVAPAEAERHGLLIEHIAGLEKPAYVTYSVSYEANTEPSNAPVAV